MFFEDEDKAGRERKFRWLNQKNPTDGDATEQENTNGEQNSGDENEEVWRKMRFERETLLKEQADKNVWIFNLNFSFWVRKY